MQFNNQHKALLLTLLISGTVLLFVFNLGLKRHSELATESYYEIEPEKELTEEDIKLLQALDKLNNTKAETNKAFNQTQKSQHFSQAYKAIAPPEDYVPEHTNNTSDYLKAINERYNKAAQDSKLNKEELSKFNKVNDLLKQQQSDGNNSRSTTGFSLTGRTEIHIPIPVYLCEINGKIVVNVTVNSNGNVIDAYVNTSSTSNNECLIEHALEYAKQSRFSVDSSKKTQLGSITFNFIGKH